MIPGEGRCRRACVLRACAACGSPGSSPGAAVEAATGLLGSALLALLWVLEPACVGSPHQAHPSWQHEMDRNQELLARIRHFWRREAEAEEDEGAAPKTAQAVPAEPGARPAEAAGEGGRPGRAGESEGPRRAQPFSGKSGTVPPQLWLQTSVPGWFCSACIFCRECDHSKNTNFPFYGFQLIG